MKPRHWINLLVIVGMATLLTYLALQWAIKSYVEPTCRGYAAANGMTYVDYIPLDPTTDAQQHVREGDCQMRTSAGQLQTVSVLKASGTSYGAPLLVSLALSWHLVFGAGFVGVALILALLIRAITGKPAS